MANKKTIKKARRKQEVLPECYYCKAGKNPSFLEYESLSNFTSERGKILSRSKSGICSKHQRRLTSEIKRARYIGFLPYVVRPE